MLDADEPHARSAREIDHARERLVAHRRARRTVDRVAQDRVRLPRLRGVLLGEGRELDAVADHRDAALPRVRQRALPKDVLTARGRALDRHARFGRDPCRVRHRRLRPRAARIARCTRGQQEEGDAGEETVNCRSVPMPEQMRTRSDGERNAATVPREPSGVHHDAQSHGLVRGAGIRAASGR